MIKHLLQYLDKNALASQPTTSRFNNNLDKENLNLKVRLVFELLYKISLKQ